jgi:nucleoside-diphosphate-sugar epimerase
VKQAFLTGATGFTGQYLCNELLKRGYQVFALIRKESRHKKKNLKNLEWIEGDLSDPPSLKNQLPRTDLLFHIGALYRQEGVSKELFSRVNVEGTRILLDEAVRNNVERFIHCSTVGVQGEILNPPAKETAPYNPGDHYQESKVEGEKIVLSYISQQKINGVIIRPVGIYGPGDTRFLKLFRYIYQQKFRMIGNGKALYHLTFVEDLVDGIILTSEKKGISGEIYTLGGNEYLPLDELVKRIAEILKKPAPGKHLPLWPVYIASFLCEMACRPLKIEPPLFRRRLDFFTKDRAFDISKAKTELGYDPKVSLDEGLKRTAEWYLKNGMLD